MRARSAVLPRSPRHLVRPVPTVVDEPLPPGAAVKPSDAAMAEDWLQAEAVLEQRLSRELAHLYRRNVVCAANLQPNLRMEQHDADGRKLTGNGAPKAEYMRTGKYWRMAVSIAMARQLLARDGGSSG